MVARAPGVGIRQWVHEPASAGSSMCDPAGVSDASTRVPVGGDPAAVPDPEPLGRWMDAQGLPGDGTPPSVERLSGGSQNELFALERGGARYALRRPPLGAAQDRI